MTNSQTIGVLAATIIVMGSIIVAALSAYEISKELKLIRLQLKRIADKEKPE